MSAEESLTLVQKYTGQKTSDVFEIKNRGEVNKIFVVSTREQKYIVRFDPNETTTKRFEKERWCMEAAQQKNVLTPRIHELGLHDGHPYMIMEYIDGTSGDNLEETDFVWRKLGEYSRLIQGVNVGGYGEGMVEPGVFGDTWERFIQYNISQLGDSNRLVVSKLLTQTETDLLLNVFTKLVDKPPKIGLFHYDLSLDNVIVIGERVYLIDWGSAQVGPVPHLDIAEILHSSLDIDSHEFNQFLEGFKISRNDFELLKPEILKVDLLMHADKLQWAMDKRTDLVTQFAGAVKTRLTKII